MENIDIDEIINDIRKYLNKEISFHDIDHETTEELSIDFIQDLDVDDRIKYVLEMLCTDTYATIKFELCEGLDVLWFYNEMWSHGHFLDIDFSNFPFDRITNFFELKDLELYIKIASHNINNLPDLFIDHYNNMIDPTHKFYWEVLIQENVNKEPYLKYVSKYSFNVTMYLKEEHDDSFGPYDNLLGKYVYNENVDALTNLKEFLKHMKDKSNFKIKLNTNHDLLDALLNYRLKIPIWTFSKIFDFGIFDQLSIDEQIVWKNAFLNHDMIFEYNQKKFPAIVGALKTTNETAISIFEDEFFAMMNNILCCDSFIIDHLEVSYKILQRYVSKYSNEYNRVMKFLIYSNNKNLLWFCPDITELDIRKIIYE